MNVNTVIMILSLLIPYTKPQGAAEGELAVVTFEMFNVLQSEVNGLYDRFDKLQAEVNQLATNIQNLATDTAVIGNVELAELQALIDASNKQDDDITKLVQANGIWQQNFRVINNTFERLRKVVVFPRPTLNNPSFALTPLRRISPSVQARPNTTIVKLSHTPPKSRQQHPRLTTKISESKKQIKSVHK